MPSLSFSNNIRKATPQGNKWIENLFFFSRCDVIHQPPIFFLSTRKTFGLLTIANTRMTEIKKKLDFQFVQERKKERKRSPVSSFSITEKKKKVQSSVVWKFNYFCGNKKEEEEVKVVAPKEEEKNACIYGVVGGG